MQNRALNEASCYKWNKAALIYPHATRKARLRGRSLFSSFDITELQEIMSDEELELDTMGDGRTALLLIMADGCLSMCAA